MVEVPKQTGNVLLMGQNKSSSASPSRKNSEETDPDLLPASPPPSTSPSKSQGAVPLRYRDDTQGNLQVFWDLAEVLKGVFADVKLAPWDIFYYLYSVYKDQPKGMKLDASAEFFTDTSLLEEAISYMRIASSVYGTSMLYGLMGEGTVQDWKFAIKEPYAANMQAMIEHTGVAPQDVVVAKWAADMCQPAYVITIDHKNKSLVIAVRGTWSLNDMLTDMVVHLVPFQNGYAHEGMVKAAQVLYGNLNEGIANTLKQHTGYKLVLTGHSLGAAVATLLGALMRKEYPDLRVFAFGVPPIVDRSVAQECKDFVVSMIAGKDWVARASFGNLKKLKAQVMSNYEVGGPLTFWKRKEVEGRLNMSRRTGRGISSGEIDEARLRMMESEHDTETRSMCEHVLHAEGMRLPSESDVGPYSVMPGNSTEALLGDKTIDSDDVGGNVQDLDLNPLDDVEVFIAGKILYFHRLNWLTSKSTCLVHTVGPETFDSIVLDPVMFVHHAPGIYEAAIIDALSHLKSKVLVGERSPNLGPQNSHSTPSHDDELAHPLSPSTKLQPVGVSVL